jgi:hypothetical protein
VEQIDLLRYAVDALEQMNLRYAVVGSFASGAYGEPRFTQDIDNVFELPASQIVRFCHHFPGPEFYDRRTNDAGPIGQTSIKPAGLDGQRKQA